MTGVAVYRLRDRRARDGTRARGLSCDEDGVCLAGDVPIVSPVCDGNGDRAYRVRPIGEIEFLLSAAFGRSFDSSARASQLHLVARYMTEGKWVLAKIAAVQLRLTDLPDCFAVARILTAHSLLARAGARASKFDKRDVSDEPRVPAGQSGGDEWEAEDGDAGQSPSDPLLIPAQAVPVPFPIPFDLPLPPTEISPYLDIPSGNTFNPTNPYPDRPECVDEWAHAEAFCRDQEKQGKLKPGYSGFGKDFQRCVLGMVSAECGGNPFGA